MNRDGFFRNHADTLSIIGVNLAIAAILMTICLSNIASISSVNARMDSLHVMIYDEMKDFHGRLCAIEERNRK